MSDISLLFNTNARHTITEANINYYADPFVHPARIMNDHDFIYMLSGEWKIGQNNEVFPLKKDALLILCANNHHYGAAPCKANTKTMYFHTTFENGEQLCQDNQAVPKGFEKAKIWIDASTNSNIKKYFYEIVNAKLSAQDKKAQIFFDLLMCEISSANEHSPNKEVGERIKNIIHRSPERFFSNKELADMVGVSTKTAEIKFKSLYGITIHQYMLHYKTERAISYYKNFPEMSMKEIAYNLGFYDEYHFSKQFKKATGSSPSAYKKNNTSL